MAAAATPVLQVPSVEMFERFDEEGLDLRDEATSASMFEEIVGVRRTMRAAVG
jgi:hypothetical protein